ncbi:hypothetical protein SAMN06295960_1352 [Paenibacillus aquistagni]|uniref:Uncharacterized protein n=1 Tax=Paenibacillus aquistagni TaxID=1852522 RepID=A0A1X7J9V2_9BACL|nr:hypothetical protein SAMN06295960_1352 [Paenibacillus aquistagni]
MLTDLIVDRLGLFHVYFHFIARAFAADHGAVQAM